MKILLAEDEPAAANLFKSTLEKRNHDVIIAKDGEICLKEYKNSLEKLGSETNKKSPFDVVVLDIKMPNKDGVQTAKEILVLNPSQRILFSSAFVKECLVDSLKDFIHIVSVYEKPFDLEGFVETIEDKEAYDKLEKLNIKFHQFGELDPTNPEIEEMIKEVTKKQKPELWYSVGNLVIG